MLRLDTYKLLILLLAFMSSQCSAVSFMRSSRVMLAKSMTRRRQVRRQTQNQKRRGFFSFSSLRHGLSIVDDGLYAEAGRLREIKEYHHQGAYSKVLHCRDSHHAQPDTKVIIKMVHPNVDRESSHGKVAREFLTGEIQIMKSLEKSVRYIAISETDTENIIDEHGGTVLLTDYVGDNLVEYGKQIARARRTKDFDKMRNLIDHLLLTIVPHIICGMEQLHSQGIIHRDLRLPNVVIDSKGDPKIIDFGIAKHRTDFTDVEGSFVYMPPEGLEAHYELDVLNKRHRALRQLQHPEQWDVWQVGCLILNALDMLRQAGHLSMTIQLDLGVFRTPGNLSQLLQELGIFHRMGSFSKSRLIRDITKRYKNSYFKTDDEIEAFSTAMSSLLDINPRNRTIDPYLEWVSRQKDR